MSCTMEFDFTFSFGIKARISEIAAIITQSMGDSSKPIISL